MYKSVKKINKPLKPTLSSPHTVEYQELINTPQSLLSSDLGSEEKFTDYKRLSRVVASAYARSDNQKVINWSKKMQFCASNIAYAYQPQADKSFKRTIASINLCRIKTCPMCQWRRSLALSAKIGEKLKEVLKDKTLSAYMLTLTIRNDDINNLKYNIKNMLKAWSKLTKRVVFAPVVHWTRAVEITRGREYIENDSHPHMHCILVVKTADLPRDFSFNTKWCRLWQDVLNLNYVPQCDIRPIDQTKGAIQEVLKYCVKPEASIAVTGWLEKVALQIDGLRMLGVSKSLNDIKLDNLEDFEGVSQNVMTLPYGIINTGKTAIVIYRWANYQSEYHRKQVHYMSLAEYKEGIYIQNCINNGVVPATLRNHYRPRLRKI